MAASALGSHSTSAVACDTKPASQRLCPHAGMGSLERVVLAAHLVNEPVQLPMRCPLSCPSACVRMIATYSQDWGELKVISACFVIVMRFDKSTSGRSKSRCWWWQNSKKAGHSCRRVFCQRWKMLELPPSKVRQRLGSNLVLPQLDVFRSSSFDWARSGFHLFGSIVQPDQP